MSVIWFCRGCPDHLVADMEAAGHTAVGPAMEERAEAHGRAYGVTGVPALIVDGRYRVDGRMAGNNTNMLKVVEYLVAQRQGGAADVAGAP